ncbi:MAG: ribonuclease E inhibitor RraB [Acidobacteriota bacterium]
MATYPRDADGDALRRVADDGSDMARPMVVDFMIAARDEAVGRAIAAAVGPLGYRGAARARRGP